MKRLNKKYLIIILAVIISFLLPFLVQNNKPVFAEFGEGANCNAVYNGVNHNGKCWSRDRVNCSTYYDSRNFCPGDNSVQCCVTTKVTCRNGTGECHNRYASGFGNAYACSGTWYTGLCPGPSDVQCCVPAPTATPTLTPTATPTLTPTLTPPPPSQGSTTTPGIIFTGDGSAEFGSGQSSAKGWVVGGATYPEVFSQSVNPSPISYQRLLDKAKQAKLTMINLTTYSNCTNLTNCTLPAGLEHGIYTADATQAGGTLNLNAHTFLAGRDYIFLIKGNLKIMGNIITPAGSTVLFAVSNDVIINRTVGSATNSYPLPTGQVQALFNADRNFIVDGIGSCATGTDKMLNIEGAIVTNTGVGLTGTFKNFRNLCVFNATIPSVTIKPRLDFLLNAPLFIMTTNTTFRETP